MLNANCRESRIPGRQTGVVLLMALIMLVSLTLAGIAMVRSVDTSVLIAGNLAFKSSATDSGDRGTEAAVNYLVLNKNNLATGDDLTNGYRRYVTSPSGTQSWSDFFATIPSSEKVSMASDSAGNTVEYVIHRLCAAPVAPATTPNCAAPQGVATSDGNKSGDNDFVAPPTALYYRITSRITGPRSTSSLIQAVIAL